MKQETYPSTEFTGQKFVPVFYRALADWHEGGKVGLDPRDNWEIRSKLDHVWMTCITKQKTPAFFDHMIYRLKPLPKRRVAIGYANVDGEAGVNNGSNWKTLVAPETVAPAEGKEYFAKGRVHTWYNNDIGCKQDLRSGRVFLCCEDSNDMEDFLTLCRNGCEMTNTTLKP